MSWLAHNKMAHLLVQHILLIWLSGSFDTRMQNKYIQCIFKLSCKCQSTLQSTGFMPLNGSINNLAGIDAMYFMIFNNVAELKNKLTA